MRESRPPAPSAGPARPATRRPMRLVLPLCAAALLAVLTVAIGTGPVPLSPAAVWHVLLSQLSGHPGQSVAAEIVWQIRVPRVLLAALIGAALTTAGTVVQVLVRNALADPFLLGVSSGASVGATAVLLLGALGSLGLWAISVGSIVGALVAMLTVFAVASRPGGRLAPTQLILRGAPRPSADLRAGSGISLSGYR